MSEFDVPDHDESLLMPEDPKTEALALLGDTGLIVQTLKVVMDNAVEQAREHGASWREVGEALGVTPAAAYQRWAEGAREKHAARQRRRIAGRTALNAPSVEGL